MTLLLFGGAFVFALRRRGLETIGWCAAFIGGALLDATLRLVVRRSELPFADIVLIDWGTGLASGHVLGVVVGFGMLAYLILSFVRQPVVRSLVLALAMALVAAITISRLYLGQHFISDASAGIAAGLIWLADLCVRNRDRSPAALAALAHHRSLGSFAHPPSTDRRRLGDQRGVQAWPMRAEQIAARDDSDHLTRSVRDTTGSRPTPRVHHVIRGFAQRIVFVNDHRGSRQNLSHRPSCRRDDRVEKIAARHARRAAPPSAVHDGKSLVRRLARSRREPGANVGERRDRR